MALSTVVTLTTSANIPMPDSGDYCTWKLKYWASIDENKITRDGYNTIFPSGSIYTAFNISIIYKGVEYTNWADVYSLAADNIRLLFNHASGTAILQLASNSSTTSLGSIVNNTTLIKQSESTGKNYLVTYYLSDLISSLQSTAFLVLYDTGATIVANTSGNYIYAEFPAMLICLLQVLNGAYTNLCVWSSGSQVVTTGTTYTALQRYTVSFTSDLYAFTSTPATQYVTAGSTLSSLPSALSVVELDSYNANVNYSFPEGSGTLSDSSLQTVPVTYAARRNVTSWRVGTTNIGSPGAAFYPSSSVVATAVWGDPIYDSSGLPTSSAFTTKGFTAAEGYDVGSLWNYNGTSVAYGDVFPSLTFTGLVDSITLSTSSNIDLILHSNFKASGVEDETHVYSIAPGASYSIPSADLEFTAPSGTSKAESIVYLTIDYNANGGSNAPSSESFEGYTYLMYLCKYTDLGYWTSTANT